MATTTYTITKADGSKVQKTIEYTPKTIEEIYAEAAKAEGGATENNLYNIAVAEGRAKARFDAVTQQLSGIDKNVTEDDVSNILSTAERSTAAALNRDRINVAVDEIELKKNMAADDLEFKKNMPASGYSAAVWEAKLADTRNKTDLLSQLQQGGGANLLNLDAGSDTGGQILAGYDVEEELKSADELAGRGGAAPVLGAANIDPTGRALGAMAPYDVFQQALAFSPYSAGPLGRAAQTMYEPLQAEFLLQGFMPTDTGGLDMGAGILDRTDLQQQNAFANFLRGPRVGQGGYLDLIRRAGDIGGMSAGEFADPTAGYIQDPRSLALRDLFTSAQAPEYELAAAQLPFQQISSSAARSAIGNTINNLFNRFRAQYPITTEGGDPSSFLNFMRARNVGGMFTDPSDVALRSRFPTSPSGGVPRLFGSNA